MNIAVFDHCDMIRIGTAHHGYILYGHTHYTDFIKLFSLFLDSRDAELQNDTLQAKIYLILWKLDGGAQTGPS